MSCRRAVDMALLTALLATLLLVQSFWWAPGASRAIPSSDEHGDFVHSVVLLRHGLRAPGVFDEKFLHQKDYPYGADELTSQGRVNSFKLGKVMRHLYKDVLSEDPKEITARSSSVRRCYDSLALMLASMYPPKRDNPIEHDLPPDWRPIQISNVPTGHDYYIESCNASVMPDFKYLYNETDIPGFKTGQEFFHYLTEKSGYPKDTSDFFPVMVDGIVAQKWNRLPVPKWIEDMWPAMNWAISKLSYEYYKTNVPYYGEHLTKDIAAKLRSMTSVQSDNTSKITFLGYHDTNIQAVLSGLDFDYVANYPYFSSSLHFQLFRNPKDNEHYVKVLYSTGFNMDNEYLPPKEIHFKGCPHPCKFETMEKLLKDAFPSGSANYDNCATIAPNVML